MSQAAIHVKGLTKSYQAHHILKGVDFDVPSGHIFALLGSNERNALDPYGVCIATHGNTARLMARYPA